MKNIILLTVILLLIGCKSASSENKKYFNLSQVYRNAYNSNIVEIDPIVVIDGKLYGVLSEIDSTEIQFKGLEKSFIQVIPKNNYFLEKYFGEYSKRGIISIKKHLTLVCDGRPQKSIYICNNKTISLEEIGQNKYYVVGGFDSIIENNLITRIIILTTDKKLSNKINKTFF